MAASTPGTQPTQVSKVVSSIAPSPLSRTASGGRKIQIRTRNKPIENGLLSVDIRCEATVIARIPLLLFCALLLTGCGTPLVPVDDDDLGDDDDLSPPMVCNGHAELCDLPFDQLVFPATHNSMSNAAEGWIAPNQQHGLRRQLEDGIRGMLIDTKEWNGELYLCHGACELGSILLADALAVLRDFLVESPSDLLVLVIQDDITSEQTAEAFAEAGLDSYVYSHNDDTDWPLVRDLVEADTRLLVSAEAGGPPPAWYHHAWDLFQDTDYAFSDASAIHCDPNRGSEDSPLFLMNHWVDGFLGVPVEADAAEANSAKVLEAQIARCDAERGLRPTLLAVDFYAAGDLFEVVDHLNGGDGD